MDRQSDTVCLLEEEVQEGRRKGLLSGRWAEVARALAQAESDMLAN